MRTSLKTTIVLLLAGSCASLASAQIAVPWSTIDCGGGTASGTSVSGTVISLSGTIGQPDAGAPLTGTSAGGVAIALSGGFWAGIVSRPHCPADFNSDGDVNPDDLGDYITCYFTEPPCPGADFNTDADVNPDDLGDYITTYFGPPC